MIAEIPSSKTTLAILLGASEWPEAKNFETSYAFENSCRSFRDYLLSPALFCLDKENLLDLFDSQQDPFDIDKEIGGFLEERISKMKESGNPAQDVLIYFVGHGGFTEGDSHYYLAIRSTQSYNPTVSSILIESLARTLKEKARHLRRILILDCCFAASASRFFQTTEPTQIAIAQTIDAFKALEDERGDSRKGTSLLCSSGHNIPSLISENGTYTLFSEALLCVLHTRYASLPSKLSLRTVASLTEQMLIVSPPVKAPRPEVHSPDQKEVDVADIPFFPNPTKEALEIFQRQISIKRKRKKLVLPSRRFLLTGGLITFGAIGLLGIGGYRVWELLIPHPLYTHHINTDFTQGVSWSPDGTRIALSSDASTIQIWNPYSGDVFTYHSHFYYAVAAWSPDSARIAVGGDVGIQTLDSIAGGHLFTYHQLDHSGINAIAWSHDGISLALAGDNFVLTMNAADGKNLQNYYVQNKDIIVAPNGATSVTWSHDNTKIASGSRDKTVRIWDTSGISFNALTYDLHSDIVRTVAWSPDGTRIASGSDDTTVHIWNPETGGHIFTYRGHSDWVRTVAWSHDSSRIASCSCDGTVQVWDATNGGLFFTYRGHTGCVFTLSWSPDDLYIVSGGQDKTVQVWKIGG